MIIICIRFMRLNEENAHYMQNRDAINKMISKAFNDLPMNIKQTVINNIIAAEFANIEGKQPPKDNFYDISPKDNNQTETQPEKSAREQMKEFLNTNINSATRTKKSIVILAKSQPDIFHKHANEVFKKERSTLLEKYQQEVWDNYNTQLAAQQGGPQGKISLSLADKLSQSTEEVKKLESKVKESKAKLQNKKTEGTAQNEDKTPLLCTKETVDKVQSDAQDKPAKEQPFTQLHKNQQRIGELKRELRSLQWQQLTREVKECLKACVKSITLLLSNPFCSASISNTKKETFLPGEEVFKEVNEELKKGDGGRGRM